MSNSQILGKCDMVLAISEDTINYQFSQLFDREIINNKWNIMIFENEDGTIKQVLVDQSDEEFKTHINTQDFDYAFNATLSAPTISILPDEQQTLTLFSPFESGNIYYWVGHGHASTLKSSDMSGWYYGFKVHIGSEGKDAEDVKWITPESKESFEKNTQNAGLDQQLFSIESLFMDFENANYAEYDSKNSKVPTNIEELAIFQNLLSNYFTSLAGTNNPYIFGYGMKLKETKETAVFSPTALRYSTSYNADSSLSAFNFLMMTSGNAFPSDQSTGILPGSLIAEKGSNISGALAIDFTLFNDKFLKPFVTAIEGEITKGFDTTSYSRNGQKWTLNTNDNTTIYIDDGESDFFKKTENKTFLNLVSDMTLQNSNASCLSLDTSITYDMDIQIRPWSILHLDYHTEAEFWYSTSGEYDVGPDKVHKGQAASVSIKFSLAGEGKMSVDYTMSIPYLGETKAPAMPSNMSTPDMQVIQSFRNDSFTSSAAADSAATYKNLSEEFVQVKTNLDTAINSVNSGSIILPLGKIYEFKNIQLISTENLEDNPIRILVNYAPES